MYSKEQYITINLIMSIYMKLLKSIVYLFWWFFFLKIKLFFLHPHMAFFLLFYSFIAGHFLTKGSHTVITSDTRVTLLWVFTSELINLQVRHGRPQKYRFNNAPAILTVIFLIQFNEVLRRFKRKCI